MSERAPTTADLERTVERIAAVLGDDGRLIGGLAVAAWGYVRGTDDVDFLTRRDPAILKKQLAAEGIRCRIRRGDPTEGDPDWVIQGTLSGVRFDILPPLVPVDWERPLVLHLGGNAEIRVVDVRGLVRLKLRAHGPQDLMDTAALVLRHPELAGEALETAESYAVRDLLERWLADDRLAAEIEHQRGVDGDGRYDSG